MKFYRYEIKRYASYNDYDDFPIHIQSYRASLSLDTYELKRETSKGYWIGLIGLSESLYRKWIPKNSKKRYAYPTKKEALNNFIKRTESRIKHCENTLSDCKYRLGLAIDLAIEQHKKEI